MEPVVTCITCKGSGKCVACLGTGKVPVQDSGAEAVNGAPVADCDTCLGSGACQVCRGTGFVPHMAT